MIFRRRHTLPETQSEEILPTNDAFIPDRRPPNRCQADSDHIPCIPHHTTAFKAETSFLTSSLAVLPAVYCGAQNPYRNCPASAGMQFFSCGSARITSACCRRLRCPFWIKFLSEFAKKALIRRATGGKAAFLRSLRELRCRILHCG